MPSPTGVAASIAKGPVAWEPVTPGNVSAGAPACSAGGHVNGHTKHERDMRLFSAAARSDEHLYEVRGGGLKALFGDDREAAEKRAPHSPT